MVFVRLGGRVGLLRNHHQTVPSRRAFFGKSQWGVVSGHFVVVCEFPKPCRQSSQKCAGFEIRVNERCMSKNAGMLRTEDGCRPIQEDPLTGVGEAIRVADWSYAVIVTGGIGRDRDLEMTEGRCVSSSKAGDGRWGAYCL